MKTMKSMLAAITLAGALAASQAFAASSYRVASSANGLRLKSTEPIFLNDAGLVAFWASRPDPMSGSLTALAVYKGGASGLVRMGERRFTPVNGELVLQEGPFWFNQSGQIAVTGLIQGRMILPPVSVWAGSSPLTLVELGLIPVGGLSQMLGPLVVTDNGFVSSGGVIHSLEPGILRCTDCLGEFRSNMELYRDNETNLLRIKIEVQPVPNQPGVRRIVATETNVVVTFPTDTLSRFHKINDHGDVAYFVARETPVQMQGIYLVRNGTVQTIVEARPPEGVEGGFFSGDFLTGWDFVGDFAINNNGEVAFLGRSRALQN